MPLRILSIGAHPADVFDQSGGTMAHHVARGDYVACVVLTHGVRVHDKVISNDMFHADRIPDAQHLSALFAERADVKAEETRQACAHLGVKDIYFLGADDAVLRPHETNIRQVARLIRQLKPDIILTHYPKESGGVFGNPHAAAGEIVMNAIPLAAGIDPGDSNPPHKVVQVFFYGAGAASIRSHLWSSEPGFYNDVFIDISDVIHLKLKSLDSLKSQGYAGAYARKRLETNDGAFGNHAKVPYAEGFIRLRSETHSYLPLSEKDLTTARLSDHQVIAQMSHRFNPPPPES